MAHMDKRQVSIIVNNGCNIGCTYCYAQDEHKNPYQVIDEDFAKQGIRDFFEQGNNQIRFFGLGEPTLEINLMDRLIDYGRSIVGDRLVTEIQTNGVMCEDKALWVAKNINNVWLSWDGPPYAHDHYRVTKDGKPTSAHLERTAHILRDRKYRNGTGGFVGARVTISHVNMGRQRELIDYFRDYGVTMIYGDPIFAPVKENGASSMFKRIDPQEYCENFIDAYAYGKKKGVFYGSFYMINFDKKCEYHCRSCAPTPHLTFDGLVSACDMALSRNSPPHMQKLIYGEWNAETKNIMYDKRSIQEIRSRNVNNIPECKACDVKEHCGGGCIGEALNETKDFYGVIQDNCFCTKYLSQRLPVGNISIPALHP